MLGSGQAVATGDITTVAGGVGGPDAGTNVSLGFGQNALCGVSYDSGGLYVADSDVVREVDPQTGWLTTPVGTGTAGPLGDGGPAAGAELTTCGATLDHSGNLVIADLGSSRVRVVAAGTGTFYGQAMTAGDIYTVAGNGQFGFAGEGRLATTAKLDGPSAVAVDGAGNLVISDSGNDRVRVVADQHRHLLRAGDDRQAHLHGGRKRHLRVLRRRRPGHRGRADQPGPDGGGRRGEPGHRRQCQRPGPGGRGQPPAPSTGRR